MSSDQTEIFRSGEGDAWFERNHVHLARADRPDLITEVMRRLPPGSMESVCEVGCADGWRLDRLGKAFPCLRRRAGFDVSEAAIAAGKSRSPDLELEVGVADSPPIRGPFDLVIVSFVLHWIARDRLAYSVAAIDRLVADEGLLVVVDFDPGCQLRAPYHHVASPDVYTYKQSYSTIFEQLGLYRQIYGHAFDHSDLSGAVGLTGINDRASISVLKKSLVGYYQ